METQNTPELSGQLGLQRPLEEIDLKRNLGSFAASSLIFSGAGVFESIAKMASAQVVMCGEAGDYLDSQPFAQPFSASMEGFTFEGGPDFCIDPHPKEEEVVIMAKLPDTVIQIVVSANKLIYGEQPVWKQVSSTRFERGHLQFTLDLPPGSAHVHHFWDDIEVQLEGSKPVEHIVSRFGLSGVIFPEVDRVFALMGELGAGGQGISIDGWQHVSGLLREIPKEQFLPVRNKISNLVGEVNIEGTRFTADRIPLLAAQYGAAYHRLRRFHATLMQMMPLFMGLEIYRPDQPEEVFHYVIA